MRSNASFFMKRLRVKPREGDLVLPVKAILIGWLIWGMLNPRADWTSASMASSASSFQLGKSSNLFSNGTSVDISLPNTGLQADIEFTLSANGVDEKISATIYGNDYSQLEAAINSVTGTTAISADMVGANRIRLSNTGEEAILTDFKISNFDAEVSKIGIIKDTATDILVEQISDQRLNSSNIRSNITNMFEHFSTKRAEVGALARRAEENENAQQDVLMMLEIK